MWKYQQRGNLWDWLWPTPGLDILAYIAECPGFRSDDVSDFYGTFRSCMLVWRRHLLLFCDINKKVYYPKISTYTSWSSFLTHILYSWFILLAQEISSGHLPKYSTLLGLAFQLGRFTVAKIRVKSIYLSPRHLLSSLLPGGSLTSLVEVVIKLLAHYQFWSQGAW